MSQTLILEVAGRQAAQFGSRARKAFEGKGGSIGRSEDCDWVLSASGVSRVHAMIRLLNGMYFIEDRSTNGMLLNGAPLVKGDPSPLKDGDRLLIDSFEVECRFGDAGAALPAQEFEAEPAPTAYRQPEPAPAPLEDPFDFSMLDAPMSGRAAPPLVTPPSHNNNIGNFGSNELIPDMGSGMGSSRDDLDPLSFLGPLDGPGSLTPGNTGGGQAPSWNHSAGMADSFRPPSSTMSISQEHRQTSSLPENWDLTMGDFAPRAAPPPVARPTPTPPSPPPRAVTPPPAPPAPTRGFTMPEAPPAAAALPADVDHIFRVVVDGVMDVLRARAEIKNTFRLPVTIIQRSENNPLKFAPTSEEALQKILGPASSAFLSGPAAFEDAFDDIRCHQMAMLAGVRAAFESLLMHFKPERFEHEVDGGAKKPGFMDFAAGKGKYWDKYKDNFDGLSKNPDECFRRLFGDEFARAYEEQLSRLKSARRMQKSMQR